MTRRIQLLFAFIVVACAGLFAVPAEGGASQPILVNYQAKLTDADGAPLDGAHTMFFALYLGGDAATANSGGVVYSETASVTADRGVVSHVIGSGTPVSGVLDDAAFSADTNYYLQIAVDTTANVVLPRQLITTVPFAARARVADTATTAANGLVSGQVIFTTSPAAPEGFTATGNTLANAWMLRRPLITARTGVELVSVNGLVLSVGGSSVGVGESPVVEVYEPATSFASTTSSLLQGRRMHRATELNGKVYVTGGITASGFSKSVEIFSNSTWTAGPSMLNTRTGHGAAACNGKLYVFGGSSSTTTGDAAEVFDPLTNAWSPITSTPQIIITNVSAAAVGTKIHLFGMTISGPVHFVYDTVLNSYTALSIPHFPSGRFSPVSHLGKIYLYGFSNYTPEVLIYDTATASWSVGPSNLVQTHSSGACVCNGTLYLGGGTIVNTSNAEKRLESWSPPIYYAHSRN